MGRVQLWVRKEVTPPTNLLLDLWNLLASGIWDDEYSGIGDAAEYVDDHR